LTDAELIRAAARAANYAIHAYRQAERDRDYPEQIGLWIPDESTCWNPLIDSGHALRLAVNLGLEVFTKDEPSDDASATAYRMDEIFSEPRGTDPYAATRRAIVRAAAALAKDTDHG
jgi:hypothetical protein